MTIRADGRLVALVGAGCLIAGMVVGASAVAMLDEPPEPKTAPVSLAPDRDRSIFMMVGVASDLSGNSGPVAQAMCEHVAARIADAGNLNGPNGGRWRPADVALLILDIQKCWREKWGLESKLALVPACQLIAERIGAGEDPKAFLRETCAAYRGGP